MALADDERGLITFLERQLAADRRRIERYDRYLEGEQPLRYMAPQLEVEVGFLVTQLVINWPMLVVDAYENRLDIVGFRYADQGDRDPMIWDWWQTVDGDEQSQLAHFEALGLSRAYAVVGAGDGPDDAPVLTIEHPFEMTTKRDPRTRAVTAGLKRWKGDGNTLEATLYTPDATIMLERAGRAWVEAERDDHRLGEVPVVPLVHRPRLLRPDGRSIFHDVIPLADAANKMATDMMLSGEFHAMPRRWAIGMSEEDFIDEHGKQMDAWSTVKGRLWSTEKSPDEVAVGQFTESDLSVFHNTIKLLAQLVGHLIGLPNDYLSFTSTNPPSADAVRATETRMVKRAERIQTPFSGSWENVVRLGLRFMENGDELPPEAASLVTVWNDPATPTRAQQADATVKLVTAGVLPIEQARIDLGYDEEQRRRMAEMDAAVPAPPPAPGGPPPGDQVPPAPGGSDQPAPV